MADDQAGLIELLKVGAALLAGAVIKPAFDYLSGRRKFAAEAKQIELTSERLIQHDLREWMDIAQNATRRLARFESVLEEILPYRDRLPDRTAERMKRILNEGGDNDGSLQRKTIS